MSLERVRAELAEYSKRILRQGLATGAGGNISAREGPAMLISPSGFSLEEVKPEEYVAVDIATGAIEPGAPRPSSEVLMHLACYRRRPDIRALIHTHPQYTIALTSSGHDLKPMFADFVIYLGYDIPHVDYVTVTTPELACAVEAVVGEANCVILRNHGAITLGENLKQAFWRACTVEEGARIQLLAATAGAPRFLSREEAGRLTALSSEQYRQQLLARMRTTS